MKKIIEFIKKFFCYMKQFFCKTKKYQMYYTTYNNDVCNITYAYPHPFGDNNVVSNVYEKNYGVITFEKPLTCISAHTFSDSTNLKTITIPESVIDIETGAFNNKTIGGFYGKFASPDTISLIKDSKIIALALANIKNYTIPNDIKEFPHIFSNLKRNDLIVTTNENCGTPYDFEYSYIQLITNAKSIPNNSFKNNVFSKITLGESVQKIGKNAFMRSKATYDYEKPSYKEFNNNCQIICYANKPPQMDDTYTFGGIYPGTDEDWNDKHFAYKNIYVPDNSLNIYKKEWSYFKNYIQKISLL